MFAFLFFFYRVCHSLFALLLLLKLLLLCLSVIAVSSIRDGELNCLQVGLSQSDCQNFPIELDFFFKFNFPKILTLKI